MMSHIELQEKKQLRSNIIFSEMRKEADGKTLINKS